MQCCSIYSYIDVKSQLTARDSLISNMGNDTPDMGDGPSSTNNDPFPAEESYIIPDAPSSTSTNNDPSAESHIIPDAPSSTNNDPFPAEESHIIPDAPCSVHFTRKHKLEAKRKQLESLFDTKKQELLRKVQLLYKKIRKLEAKRQKLDSLFDNKIQKLEAERNRLESVIKLLFNDDQRRYLTSWKHERSTMEQGYNTNRP